MPGGDGALTGGPSGGVQLAGRPAPRKLSYRSRRTCRAQCAGARARRCACVPAVAILHTPDGRGRGRPGTASVQGARSRRGRTVRPRTPSPTIWPSSWPTVTSVSTPSHRLSSPRPSTRPSFRRTRSTRRCRASTDFTHSAGSAPRRTSRRPSPTCSPTTPAGSPAPSSTSTAASWLDAISVGCPKSLCVYLVRLVRTPRKRSALLHVPCQ
jgi:hypothetical protein